MSPQCTPARRPRGRPSKDLHAPPYVVLLDGPPRFKANVPLWWIAMADMEARRRADGTWRDYGSPKKLANEVFKKPAAVSKVRRDPRYVAMVERKVLLSRPKRERDPGVRKALEDASDKLLVGNKNSPK